MKKTVVSALPSPKADFIAFDDLNFQHTNLDRSTPFESILGTSLMLVALSTKLLSPHT